MSKRDLKPSGTQIFRPKGPCGHIKGALLQNIQKKRSAGGAILQNIRTKSNLPISHVIITHSHPDHFFGTEAFFNKNVNKTKVKN